MWYVLVGFVCAIVGYMVCAILTIGSRSDDQMLEFQNKKLREALEMQKEINVKLQGGK